MDLKKLQKEVVKFRDERGWRGHRPKDLAISLVMEASEFLEHFQWKSDEELAKYIKSSKSRGLKEELADVLHNVLLIAEEFEIDLETEFAKKMKKNRKKYPIQTKSLKKH